MSNLPKNPKPHIGEKIESKPNVIKTVNYDKVIDEMVELIRENKKIIKKHTPRHNEALY